MPDLPKNVPSPERFTLVEVVSPSNTNHHGTLFGGGALALIDKFAFILATRRFRRTIVTASISHTDFHSPVQAGEMAEVSGSIVRQGNRSVEIEAELIAEDMLSGERRSCLTSRIVMVAVGKEAPPVPDKIIDEMDPPRADEVRSVEVVFPTHANSSGNLFGATALNWLGRTALVGATRCARQPVLMAASDAIDFLVPAVVSDIVEISARPVELGRTSIRIEATMCVEKTDAYDRRRCARAQFVFVAIDADGRPSPLPWIKSLPKGA